MKKIASIAILAVLPLTLASCGNHSTSSSDTSSNSSKTEKVAKSSSKSSASKDAKSSSADKATNSSASANSSKDSTNSSSNSNSASSSTSSATDSSSSADNQMSRSDLTKAEKKNGNRPLADEKIQNEQAAVALLTEKYGNQNWKVAFSSIGKSSPIYFHITSPKHGSYYVYANGDVQSADGDLSNHQIVNK
ncbi:hypothetical protein JIO05_01870 [Pediococcus acidilactici]|jgi:DNA mismatch repair ATPase MutL|uniref:hypothetical protein n=1 Tax=Pediococcus acidilactici TaxID=1254 RepID=UPI0006B417EC|nr:hypothetical protein [Pediococcus acidilactici]KAF0372742.1 hypothetical protein GBO58_03440 [Pediococcus acidilactici]KAF0383387.1 hypothetical protein GBO62_04605 [Pediococcus acidilactici]KAF0457433.1 hypothetical protein GBP02_04605 [Pediococcus acidilactici]KAF0476433.1 hypothetical protein GBP10_03650 [Pediococcus acidilactici]KAF0536954.1 hypothetical protein GBP37_03660 [Pediococcus acidilactici]